MINNLADLIRRYPIFFAKVDEIGNITVGQLRNSRDPDDVLRTVNVNTLWRGWDEASRTDTDMCVSIVEKCGNGRAECHVDPFTYRVEILPGGNFEHGLLSAVTLAITGLAIVTEYWKLPAQDQARAGRIVTNRSRAVGAPFAVFLLGLLRLWSDYAKSETWH